MYCDTHARARTHTHTHTGDGTEYDLTLKVTSYSLKEDWLMGVSYVTHTYSKAQQSLTPFYPAHYVARQVHQAKP